MRLIPGNAQHIGSRKEQQDDFGFSDVSDVTFRTHGGVVAILTDGMGGLAQGRQASLIAKQTMLAEYEEKSEHETIPQALLNALAAANGAVVKLARQARLEGQVGTTLTAAVIKDDELYWISVGDSRVYLYRRGELVQLTTDHDYARHLAQEVEMGYRSPEEAATHPQRQALTSYLGLSDLREIDGNVDPIILETGDRVLLCSDGLYKTVGEPEISALLDQHPQNAAEALIDLTLAQSRTNQDNVTVAILACEAERKFNFCSYLPNLITMNRKVILIILAILVGLGLGAYLNNYNFFVNHGKIGGTESNLLTPPNFLRLPYEEGKPSKTPKAPKPKNKLPRIL